MLCTVIHLPSHPVDLQRFTIYFGRVKAMRSLGVKQFVSFPSLSSSQITYYPKLSYFFFFIKHDDICAVRSSCSRVRQKTKLGLILDLLLSSCVILSCRRVLPLHL